MAADALEVLLGDRKVGVISALGGDQSIFSFDDAYAEDPDRPTLSLSFKGERGGLLRDPRPTQTRLAPFFSNLLPEGMLRDYLARRAGIKPVREYPLLEVLGPDLPGGVTVRPLGERALNEDAEDQQDEGSGAGGQGALRFSLAGVQLKFSAVEKARGRLTIPASGRGGDWIIKLPSTRFRGVAANEFSMMRLARAMGMDIPDVELAPLDQIEGLPEGIGRIEEEALAVRRFDRREDGGRIHIEDFAQVFGVYPGEKYDKGSYRSLAKVLWLETGEPGVREFSLQDLAGGLVPYGFVFAGASGIRKNRRQAAHLRKLLRPRADFREGIEADRRQVSRREAQHMGEARAPARRDPPELSFGVMDQNAVRPAE